MLVPSELLVQVEASLSEEPQIIAKLEAAIAFLGHREDLRRLVQRLKIASTADQHLEVYREIRDKKVFPPDAGFFLVARALEILGQAKVYTSQETNRLFLRLKDRLDAMAQEPATDEDTAREEAAERRTLESALEWYADDVRVGCFRDHGEPEMAALYANDREEYRRRFRAGRTYFFESAESPHPA